MTSQAVTYQVAGDKWYQTSVDDNEQESSDRMQESGVN